MGRINRANLKKTKYYMKRNGIRRTWYAVLERLEERKRPPYVWTPPTDAELTVQREGWEREGLSAAFSILVPAYRTKPEYLRELGYEIRNHGTNPQIPEDHWLVPYAFPTLTPLSVQLRKKLR